MTGQIQSFELESASSSLQDYALLLAVDDSSTSTTRIFSWNHRHAWHFLQSRIIGMMVLACILMTFMVITFIPTRSGSNEELLPTKTSLGFPFGDESTTTSFLVGDIKSPSTCSWVIYHGDIGLRPFGEEVDRTFCEKQQDDDDSMSENLEYSEVLRCYNVTHRLCFVNELPNGFKFDDTDSSYMYDDYSSCTFRFYDHNDVLYAPSGQQMPEAFNSRCSDQRESQLWYTLNPVTGCGAEYRYRFCHKNGTIDWDMVNSVGPFNCREFDLIDVFRMGSADESGMEERCDEQAKGCADRMHRACINGKYHADLMDEADPTEECTNFVNFVDYDQLCLP
jgi:hypothetical protein